MNQILSCSFCLANLHSTYYYCCDENEISCHHCRQYGCHACKQPFIKTPERCADCHLFFRKKHLRNVNELGTCASCCRKKFITGNNQKYFGKKLSEKQRYEIYLFVKKYCTKCNKYLQPQHQEILPPHIDLCQTCRNSANHRPHVNQKDYQIGSPIKQPNSHAKNSPINQEKCISCNLEICGSSKEIEDGGKVCSYCCKQSSDNEKAWDKQRVKAQQMQRGGKMEENKENQQQKKDGSSIKSSQKGKVAQIPSIQKQEILIKSDSQQLLEKIPLDIRIDQKAELIECNDCGYYVEAIDSIWMDISDTQNVPVCRCCFTDTVTDYTHRRNIKKYKPKDQNKQNKLIGQPHSHGKQNNERKPNIVNDSKVKEIDIQQKIGEKGESKVKKQESWNDDVDHQKRKQIKQNKSQNISEPEDNKKQAKQQNFIQQVKSKQEAKQQQKSKIGSPATSSIKDPSAVDGMKNSQSKHSFASDKQNESKISTKSSIKNPETSSLQNGEMSKLGQTTSSFKVQSTIKNRKFEQEEKPMNVELPGNKSNIHLTTHKTNGKQPEKHSEYHDHQNKQVSSFPSTTSKLKDANNQYVPQSQKSTIHKSPQRQVNHYSNLSNPPSHQSYLYPVKVLPRENTENRPAVSQIRESQMNGQKTQQYFQQNTQLTCQFCQRKFMIMQRSYSIDRKPVCIQCWGDYNKRIKLNQKMNFSSSHF